MSDSRRAGEQRVNVFEVEGVYLFKHYFEDDVVFDRLGQFYNDDQYRFEVPEGEFGSLRTFLADRGYALVVESVAEFVVVVKQYSEHPENVFEQSVIQRSADGYNYFLVTDQAAVDDAVRAGATPLAATDLRNPF